MARLWSARPPREGGSRGYRAPFAVVALGLLLAGVVHSSDVVLYRSYGAEFLHHRLPAEYPAVAGLVFFLPRLLPLPYALGFSMLMAGVFVALVRVTRNMRGEPDWERRFVCYVALGTLGVIFGRFDLLPALAVVLSVQRAREGRWAPAWAWAVLGALLKIFPLVLLPGYLLLERRSTGRIPWRRVAATAGGLGACSLLQSWWAPGTLLRPLTYELHRGFEFSSVPGTLTLLLAPAHLHFGFAFGNQQVYGPGHTAVALLMGACAGAALLAVWWTAGRGRLPVEAVSLAALSAAVLTDKALAPQYLLWLAPLWAYWRLRPSWLLAAGLTTVVFPVMFLATPVGASLYADTVLAALRNALLLGGTAAWLVEGLRTCWAERATCPAVARDAMEVVPCPVTV